MVLENERIPLGVCSVWCGIDFYSNHCRRTKKITHPVLRQSKICIVARRWQVISAESGPMRIRPNIELNALGGGGGVSSIFTCWQSNIGYTEYQDYWRRYVELKIGKCEGGKSKTIHDIHEGRSVINKINKFDTGITSVSVMSLTGMVHGRGAVFKEADRTRKRHLADLRRGIQHCLLCSTSVISVD